MNPSVNSDNPSVSENAIPVRKGRGAHRRRPMLQIDNIWAPVSQEASHTLSAALAYWAAKFPDDRHDSSGRQRVQFWIDHLGADTQLSAVTEVQVRRLADALSVSNATRNRYVAALGSLYKHARDKNGPLALGYIGPSPVKGVHYDEESGKRRKSALTQAEIDGLLAASLRSSWDRMRLFLLISLTTGMRRSNIEWLRWKDIDLDTGIIMAGAKPGREWDPTKNRTPFATALDQEVIKEATRFRGSPNEMVFPGSRRTRTQHPYSIEKPFKECLRMAGLRQTISHHWLRHTAATIHARNGASSTKLMRLMNWKSELMAKTYVHLNVEDIRADVGAIGDAIRKRKG